MKCDFFLGLELQLRLKNLCSEPVLYRLLGRDGQALQVSVQSQSISSKTQGRRGSAMVGTCAIAGAMLHVFEAAEMISQQARARIVPHTTNLARQGIFRTPIGHIVLIAVP
jgi:hypothetical protein